MLTKQEFKRLAIVIGSSIEEVELQYHISQKKIFMTYLDMNNPNSWETAFDISESESDNIFRSFLKSSLGGKCLTN